MGIVTEEQLINSLKTESEANSPATILPRRYHTTTPLSFLFPFGYLNDHDNVFKNIERRIPNNQFIKMELNELVSGALLDFYSITLLDPKGLLTY